MKIQKNTRRHGFTLVELLVVIAIIAVLVAIGLGTMFKFRKAGDKVGAISNIRALQSANSIWAADHGGKYIPIYAFDEDSNSKSEWYKTAGFLAALTGDTSIVNDRWDTPNSVLDPVAFKARGKHYDKMVASYGYVQSNMPGGSWGQPGTERSFRVSQVNDPARSAAFVTCTDWIVKYNGRLNWEVGETEEGYNPNGMIAFRHSGKAAVVYYDGHAGLVSPADIKNYDTNGGEQNVFWNGNAQ